MPALIPTAGGVGFAGGPEGAGQPDRAGRAAAAATSARRRGGGGSGSRVAHARAPERRGSASPATGPRW
jgi:hypothetical protein